MPSVDPKPLLDMAKSFKWSNKKIAENADVNIRTVFSWSRKKYKMNHSAADNLCIALGTSLEEIYPYEP